MKYLPPLFTALFLACASLIQAQEREPDLVNHEMANRVYCGFVHQHQNFFHKAFSFQSVEAGLVIKGKYITGIYGSAFASNLKIQYKQQNRYVWIGQAGLAGGIVLNGQRRFHEGGLVHIGYFRLKAGERDFNLFSRNPTVTVYGGAIATPQVFGEWAALKWFKLRVGIGYSFYFFDDDDLVAKQDIENISVSFGFLFGR